MEMGGVRISISSLTDGIYDFQTVPHFYPKALLPIGSRYTLRDYSLTFAQNLAQQDGAALASKSPTPKAAE